MATSTPGPSPQPLEKEEEPPQGSPAEHLSVVSKLCYSIGGAPNQAASSAAAFYLQLFLLDVARIPAAQASLILFVGKLSGAAADPAAGFLISRSPWTRLGRLTPWILGCSPFLALTYFLLWFLPPITHLRGLWYGAFYCLFQALSTLQQVPFCALTMFLTQNQQERDSATAYRMTMEMVGTLIGATTHGLIVAGAHKAPKCPEANLTDPLLAVASSISPHTRQLYMVAAGLIAGTYPLCASLLALGTTEEDALYILEQRRVPFFQGLGLTLRHQPYQKLVASFLFISAAVQVQQSYLVLFCTHAASLHSHVQSLVLLVLVMVPSALLLAAAPSAPLAYVVALASGASIAVASLLPWSMLPDVVDDFRLRRLPLKGLETLFYSSYVFVTKLSGAGALGISTLSLEFAGYESGACKQSDKVVVALKVLIGAVPTSMVLIGLGILSVYPITEQRRQETAHRLDVLRKEGSTSSHPSPSGAQGGAAGP
ncbi:major facilitator superfamily domain-containing protein 2B isoform X2 [Dromiciops gliroides]|uniref:major facilitator superfamily domain-containing protein 2B isoform X2 n=1 Tax=Dromiciops gliroides TaxID=33562 RepID=UPI001CC78819|nr:major facilitator superfamily domain-containing protein 2B isoform X2 [Dromiciops gliroides]